MSEPPAMLFHTIPDFQYSVMVILSSALDLYSSVSGFPYVLLYTGNLVVQGGDLSVNCSQAHEYRVYSSQYGW
ncbi:hypothetical protein PG995_006578 [Apiospora arundinis]